MPDMLVNLRNLPMEVPQSAVQVRRANTWDKYFLYEWVRKHFGIGWAQCCDVSMDTRPGTCFVAVVRNANDPRREVLQGFACYDVAARGVFGPMGVDGELRGQGIGAALVVNTLHAMKNEGYAYAIIGQVGPAEFYTKVVGAELIRGSDPGTARQLLM